MANGVASEGVHGKGAEPDDKEMRLVISASSVGTVFEWYDFFIYGTLAASGIIGRVFFPSGNETLQTLLAWAGFAVGFGFRPLGAILFGYLGDKVGRKATFLVTITLMGIATAGVGLIPSAATIGIAAPILIILLRIAQGLALGGEYGGAAIYVAEHAPPQKRGFFTSFIQASVPGGFILSLIVVLGVKALIPADVWEDWGWRIPFVLSLLLLAISLWMRLKLSESPIFKKMKSAGELAGNPFVESFTYPGNKKRIFVALFGLSAGLTVIWYTAYFSSLSFLKGPMRIDGTAAEIIVGVGAALGLFWFLLFGRLSDRIGRKTPIMWGYGLTLVLLFPIFWGIGAVANPALTDSFTRAPIVVSGPDCSYNPFASEQASACGQLLGDLSARGVDYTLQPGDALALTVGRAEVAALDAASIDTALASAGYDFSPIIPSAGAIAIIIVLLMILGGLSGATYGPMAALLTEMFPPKIRYSSMSIPYHFGTGYFGGFLPLIAAAIIATTGDPYAGLWYTWGVTLMAFIVTWWGLPKTLPGWSRETAA